MNENEIFILRTRDTIIGDTGDKAQLFFLGNMSLNNPL